MRRSLSVSAVILLTALASASATAQTAASSWIVDNHGRTAGTMEVRRTRDSMIVRHIYTDRNRGGRVETRYALGPDGGVRGGEQRAVLPDGSAGPATERFEVVGDSVRFSFGTAPTATIARTASSIVGLRGGTPFEQAMVARTLLALPDRRGSMIAGGDLRASIIADTTFRTNGRVQRARLVMMQRGTTRNHQGVWLDEKGELLATDVQWFITVRRDVTALLPVFRAIELKWRAAQGEALAKTAVTATNTHIAIINGDVFDSEAGVLRPAQTVLVRGDRIVAVGAAETVTIPAGATIIDAKGKTVMPGMWDMHGHTQVGQQAGLGLTQLANGLTTVRDMAADMDVAVSIRDRERAGKLATPRLVLAGFIEGPLAWAGPTEAIARDEAEARAWVSKYAANGYKQIKLYNVVHPDLIPTIAAEAKKHGMLLSGHIPRGISIEAAVALGYDEIQHAAFLFSNFFPDSLYLPTMRAYSQVATAVAPTFDVNSAGMTKLLDFLKARGTAIDGTFNLWIGGGGAIVGAGGSTNQMKADSAYMQLIRRLYAHGIPLIAGTDNSSGSTFRRELEMYEMAGIPAPRVLQIATIDAARFMKDAADYGSISVGKVADLIIVNGKPSEKISELAKIETVLRAGRRYDVDTLRARLNR
ncbi:MAG: amidohydrolase family protein [Gemmatimonadaceae bacterium]|nr:amidohydrolase family protein [Gemmatimonadaceae bacterium]